MNKLPIDLFYFYLRMNSLNLRNISSRINKYSKLIREEYPELYYIIEGYRTETLKRIKNFSKLELPEESLSQIVENCIDTFKLCINNLVNENIGRKL